MEEKKRTLKWDDFETSNIHKLSIQEGVKCECDQCDYEATLLNNLKRHKLSLHVGVKYKCDQCDHKATNESNFSFFFCNLIYFRLEYISSVINSYV